MENHVHGKSPERALIQTQWFQRESRIDPKHRSSVASRREYKTPIPL